MADSANQLSDQMLSSKVYSGTLEEKRADRLLEETVERAKRETAANQAFNALKAEEDDLMNQVVTERFKQYPMSEKGKHRPPGSPPDLSSDRVYPRTERNWADVDLSDKRGMQSEMNRPFYPTFGTSGGGAPLRDELGQKITNIKSDPEIRFQPTKDGKFINEKAFRYIGDYQHANEYIKELDDAIREKARIKQAEKEREELLNAMHKRVDYFGKYGSGAPNSLKVMDRYTGVDLHQGYKGTNPIYTDRSVVRHYDLENYTRPGDKWRIPDPDNNMQQFDSEDNRLHLLPVSSEVQVMGRDEVRSRKEDHPFLQDTSKTPRNRHTYDVWDPFGKSGFGAPLRDEQGNVVTKILGRLDYDFQKQDWEQNNTRMREDVRKEYLRGLKSDMAAHERKKREFKEEQKRGTGMDLAEKIRMLDSTGYPQRTERGEVYAPPRNLSDISRHQLNIRYNDPLVSKTYHDQLSEQIKERNQIQYRMSERDIQEKKQHGITVDSYFWKPIGGGGPHPERRLGYRRGKLGSQLHQGYENERPLIHSDLPPSQTISQPQAQQEGSNRMSFATQTERQYQVQAPFATEYAY